MEKRTCHAHTTGFTMVPQLLAVSMCGSRFHPKKIKIQDSKNGTGVPVTDDDKRREEKSPRTARNGSDILQEGL